MRRLPWDQALVHAGERVCCAVSGGADSVALLCVLKDANDARESLGAVLTAVHVHHGLRGAEADADEAFVRELCARLQVPLRVEHVNTRARQAEQGEGLEEAARELRYGVFRDLLAARQADAVATGHTRNDQAETVMMKLLRGAWTEGLGGISPVLPLEPAGGAPRLAGMARRPGAEAQPGKLIRPLLNTSRADIESYLQERGQKWREDSSNGDLALTRNRVRQTLMPLLRSFNPQVDILLAQTAGVARDEEAYWKAETARLLPGMLLPGKPVRGGGRTVSTAVGESAVAVELERLRPLAPALQRRLLRAAAETVGSRISAEETAKLMALAGLQAMPGMTAKPGSRLDLAGGLRAERSVRELRLFRAAQQ